jgi:DNA-binding PadR family transcriptional regulator
MEYKLLLLGLLKSAEMHGYQLHETIEDHLGNSAQLKKPTLYKLLNTLRRLAQCL